MMKHSECPERFDTLNIVCGECEELNDCPYQEKSMRVDSDEAHKRSEKVKALKKDIVKNFLELGIVLKDAKDAKDWQVLGYESMDEYAENHHNIKRSTMYNFIGIVEDFGLLLAKRQELLECDHTRLVELHSVVKGLDQGEREKWLEIACREPKEGWNNYIREARGKTPTDECNHDNMESGWLRCRECNKFRKEDG